MNLRITTQARSAVSGAALLLLTLLAAGCSSSLAIGGGHEESLVRRLEHEEAAGDAHGSQTSAKRAAHDFEHLLAGQSYIRVKHDADMPPFDVLTRTDKMGQYPCSACHNDEYAAQLEANSLPTGVEGAEHREISMDHAGDDVMSCDTCHTTDAMDQLHYLTGSPIDFDESYLLCAQCHSPQVEEWLGGGHGKRVGGWAASRVVESCMGCHNPHAPGFDTRMPAVINGGS